MFQKIVGSFWGNFFPFILLNFIAFAIDFARRNVKFTLMQILKENVLKKNAIVANKYG